MEFGYAISTTVVIWRCTRGFSTRALGDGHQNWVLPCSNTQDPINIMKT